MNLCLKAEFCARYGVHFTARRILLECSANKRSLYIDVSNDTVDVSKPQVDYMIGLMCQDGFVQAEAWLQNALTPPSDVAHAILVRTPTDLQP
jgi:hypothetical protein